MKALWVSLILSISLIALAGGGFLAWSAAQPRPLPVPSTDGGALEARFAEVLERLQGLENDLSALGRKASAPAGGPAGAGIPASFPESAPSVVGGKAPAARPRDGEDFRGLVYQFIQEEREERQLEAKLEQQARAEQRQKEIQELHQGPYGDFNYRINRLAKRLNMTQPQKQRYFELLSGYSTRIEEMRNGLDRNNPELYAAYRERKKQVQEEFEGLVIQSLTPPQAKSFQELSFSDRSAALEAASAAANAKVMTFTPDGTAVDAAVLKLGEAQLEAAGLPAKLPAAPPAEARRTK